MPIVRCACATGGVTSAPASRVSEAALASRATAPPLALRNHVCLTGTRGGESPVGLLDSECCKHCFDILPPRLLSRPRADAVERILTPATLPFVRTTYVGPHCANREDGRPRKL